MFVSISINISTQTTDPHSFQCRKYYIWKLSICNNYASCPDWRISPHADRHETQILYNTGRHLRRPVFHSTHGPWLSKFVAPGNDRQTCYRFFNFWPWGLPLGQRSPKGEVTYYPRRSTILQKFQPDRANGVPRYALPKFFSLWRRYLTPQGHPRSNLTVPIESSRFLRISAPGAPTSCLSPFSRYFESKFWLLTFWPWSGQTQGQRSPKGEWSTIHIDLPSYKIFWDTVYIIWIGIFKPAEPHSRMLVFLFSHLIRYRITNWNEKVM